jgi:hypothetical protein
VLYTKYEEKKRESAQDHIIKKNTEIEKARDREREREREKLEGYGR